MNKLLLSVSNKENNELRILSVSDDRTDIIETNDLDEIYDWVISWLLLNVGGEIIIE